MATYISFNSVYELGKFVQDSKTAPEREDQNNCSIRFSDSLCSGFSFDAAIECAMSGGQWKEGAERMPALDTTPDDSTAMIEQERLNASPVGFAPIVPNVLAGTPDSMMTFDATPAPAKVVRLAVHIGRSGRVEDYATYNRGAAILGAIDQLEQSGTQCELWAVWRNQRGCHQVEVRVLIKDAGESWEPAKAAFAFCSLAFQRRLCWRVAEVCDNGRTKDYKISSKGYGQDWEPDNKFKRDFDAYIPRMNSSAGYRSIDDALETVKYRIESKFN